MTVLKQIGTTPAPGSEASARASDDGGEGRPGETAGASDAGASAERRIAALEAALAARWREIATLTGLWQGALERPGHGTKPPEHVENARRIIGDSPLFDGPWYAARYPDVAASGLEPLEHYVRIGSRLRRDPGPGFDAGFYNRRNPDIAAGGHDALLHFLVHGRREGRPWRALPASGGPLPTDAPASAQAGEASALAAEMAEVRATGLFDAEYYLTTNPDVRFNGLDPLEHFCRFGWREDRDPGPAFSTRHYRAQVPELTEDGPNPVLHYHREGRARGLGPSAPRLPPRRRPPFPALDAPAHGPAPLAPWLREGAGGSRVLAALAAAPVAGEAAGRPPTRLHAVDDRVRAAARAALADHPQTVSVVIPTWNRRASVADAVRSALAQSHPPTEVLVVDDGSTDATAAMLAETFGPEIARGLLRPIRIPHRGVGAARNAGLRAASGDLVAYLDSDNAWRPDHLLVMAGLFAECDAVATAYAGLHLHDHDGGGGADAGAGTGGAWQALRATPYDRQHLLYTNFIDLNVFVHRRRVAAQTGGFDETLERLVDWDFVLRATGLYPPAFVPAVGVDYHLDGARLANITRVKPHRPSRERVLSRYLPERIRHGLVGLRLAYVLWDWPARSQTFVMEELRWLVAHGQDVRVYYHIDPDRTAPPDFGIEATRVRDADHLAALLAEDERTHVHAHFAYPAATLLAWPAAAAAGLPFTLFAHAVDLFHENNAKRNRIDEMARDPLCRRVFVHGDFHRRFLEGRGVPRDKLAFAFQAVDLAPFEAVRPLPEGRRGRLRCAFVGRFVEKKGLGVLVRAAALLRETPGAPEVAFDLHGYGPLEAQVRAEVAAAGLENVTFHGPLDGTTAVVAALEAADCVVVPSVTAASGDTEGFPTVILEALAAGRPVVASRLSAVPNHLQDGAELVLVAPGDPAALAEGLRRVATMAPARRQAMIETARAFLAAHVGVARTMEAYLDVWRDNRIDLVAVTHDTPEHPDEEATFAMLERVVTRTATPFTLTIVDNASQPAFRERLAAFAAARPDVRLVLGRDNLMCGPATNLALALGDAETAIYLCSKEAFVAAQGWERPLVRALRENPGDALAGHLAHLPRHTLGRDLVEHPDFPRFRSPAFARDNPERAFRHVQGGLLALRRGAVLECGGFSAAVPQGGTDVELSYHLEAGGWGLGQVPGLVSITTRTRPGLGAVIDERTVAAHPLTPASARALLDARRAMAEGAEAALCNLCGAAVAPGGAASGRGDATSGKGGAPCACGSTPFGRAVFQRLAHDPRTHRKGAALVLAADTALARSLGERMFRSVHAGTDPAAALAAAERGSLALGVLDPDLLPAGAAAASWHALAARLAPSGLLLWAEAPGTAVPDPFAAEGRPACGPAHRPSRALGQDWRALRQWVAPPG